MKDWHIVALAIIGLLISVSIYGFGAWVIIKLMQHFQII